MGEAKRRGTLEERQAAAITRETGKLLEQMVAAEKRKRADREWLASLTPEKRNEVLRTRALLAGLVAGARQVRKGKSVGDYEAAFGDPTFTL
jgi:hypothetical protein